MEFSELDELYNYLEEHAGDHKYPHQISKLFQKIRDLKHKAGKSDEVEKAQWEIDCFNYFIKNGELEPFFSGTDDKGTLMNTLINLRSAKQNLVTLKSGLKLQQTQFLKHVTAIFFGAAIGNIVNMQRQLLIRILN